MQSKYALHIAFLSIVANVQLKAQTHTYTTLSGFYDDQANNTCQYIRVNPANGNIHVIYQVADDSTNPNISRRTAYAFSTNGGTAWNNFSNIRVPSRRSGFPTMDFMRGSFAGSPIIANFFSDAADIRSGIFADVPEGSGVFSELSAPPPVSGNGDQPIWPDIAGASDGSIFLAATRPPVCGLYIFRNFNVNDWALGGFEGCISKYAIEANNNGYVGVVFVRDTALKISESTNNGVSWFPPPTTIVSQPVVIDSDTFALWGSIDFVYLDNEPVVVFGLKKINPPFLNDGAAIGFWSRATGALLAVRHTSVSGIADTLNRRQFGHLSLGYPVLGISGQHIVIGFQAFMRDTSSHGFNYSDVFWTFSIDRGRNWVSPQNLTSTRSLDERYPSISRWNYGGPSTVAVNMVWQEDTEPGSHVLDGAPVSRSKQVFGKSTLIWNSAEENNLQPSQFSLEQNYPNPFNPVTNFQFSIANSQLTILKVYDMLGREVATLVNEVKESGQYEVQFDAGNLSSGIYFYRLMSGNFSSTKKLVLLK